MAAKRGRPPKGEESRTKGLNIRLSPAELAEVGAAREKFGLSTGDLLLAFVRGEIRVSKKP